MISQMYVIRDLQAEAAMKPLLFEREAIAVRQFELSLVAKDNPFAASPEDYSLYHIGTYDDETMFLEACDPRRVVSGLEALRNAVRRQEKVLELHGQIDLLQSAGGTE